MTRFIPAAALAAALICPATVQAETNRTLVPSCTADVTIPITIYNQSHLSDGDVDAIIQTANGLWQPYGVTLVKGSARGVTVIVADGWPRGNHSDADPMVLGTTLFTDGHATPYIHLWGGAAYSLLDMVASRPLNMPQLERTSLVRPVLGVALAHEIAHLLLDTSHHALAGLLKEVISLHDLQHPTVERLRLTVEQQHVLCSAQAVLQARRIR